MTNWISPGCLCKSELEFERLYESKIMLSMAVSLFFFKFAFILVFYDSHPGFLHVSTNFQKDSTEDEQQRGEELLDEMYNKLVPSIVQRFDATVLEKDLLYIQQAVIYVRPTKMQLRLNEAFKKTNKTNFLESYSNLFLVNNHPGTLLLSNEKANGKIRTLDKQTRVLERNQGQQQDISIDETGDEENNMIDDIDNESVYEDNTMENAEKSPTTNTENCQEKRWWADIYAKHQNMAEVKNGSKMILLVNILTLAASMGEKVLVFSQCLKTLDYIENLLQQPNWGQNVPGKENRGRWSKDTDYLRLDGSTQSKRRGELVDQFNNKAIEKLQDKVKLFLLSSKAANTGINLIAANRVILFDSNWNPTIDEQAIHRCYRYGQEKPVYVYRFLTEGEFELESFEFSIVV